jgi:2-dehydro-3-deoxy-L-rhamnonate dehydrogenase (NAD+)
MNNSDKAQVAVITGASSGLGLAISKKMASLGFQLALLDIDFQDFNVASFNFKAKYTCFTIDVTDEIAVANTIQNIYADFKKIDILINCAGITGITNTKSHLVDTANLEKVFDVNFKGSFFTSKYVLPIMQEQKYGRILHIASIAGKEGNAGMLAYSASKAAVIAMAKVQGKEYVDDGITINALAPAVIQTALVDAMPSEQVKYMTDKIPMKRCGTLEEFANMALFIVSKENSFSTGFTFDLSGGRATY